MLCRNCWLRLSTSGCIVEFTGSKGHCNRLICKKIAPGANKGKPLSHELIFPNPLQNATYGVLVRKISGKHFQTTATYGGGFCFKEKIHGDMGRM